jgi:hypothetical protein
MNRASTPTSGVGGDVGGRRLAVTNRASTPASGAGGDEPCLHPGERGGGDGRDREAPRVVATPFLHDQGSHHSSAPFTGVSAERPGPAVDGGCRGAPGYCKPVSRGFSLFGFSQQPRFKPNTSSPRERGKKLVLIPGNPA